jgi:hypothetical protein
VALHILNQTSITSLSPAIKACIASICLDTARLAKQGDAITWLKVTSLDLNLKIAVDASPPTLRPAALLALARVYHAESKQELALVSIQLALASKGAGQGPAFLLLFQITLAGGDFNECTKLYGAALDALLATGGDR